MARNLVQEKREEENNKKSEALEASKEAKVEAKPTVEEKIVYITTEQVTLNNLNVIVAQLDIIHSKMIEGFRQVGVKFEEAKEK